MDYLICTEKDTLKEKMRTGKIEVGNPMLSENGKLVSDKDYDHLAQHIQNQIKSSCYLIDAFSLYDDRKNYDWVDKETGKYLKKYPDFDGENLSNLYEEVIQSLQEKGHTVYWFTFDLSQDETKILCASCNLKSIMTVLIDTIENDVIGFMQGTEYDFDTSPYLNSLSEKYRMIDFEKGNTKEKIDYLLEINDCSTYDVLGLNFWLSDNLQQELEQMLNKSWTLEDEIKKIAGCIKAIESQPEFRCSNSNIKKKLIDIIAACHAGEEVIRKTSENVAEVGFGFYKKNDLSREERVLERYIAYKLIIEAVTKDKSQVVCCGLHEVIVKPLHIKIEIAQDAIEYMNEENSFLNELFS